VNRVKIGACRGAQRASARCDARVASACALWARASSNNIARRSLRDARVSTTISGAHNKRNNKMTRGQQARHERRRHRGVQTSTVGERRHRVINLRRRQRARRGAWVGKSRIIGLARIASFAACLRRATQRVTLAARSCARVRRGIA